VAPCGKKTTSGRLLGCVIFFPGLTYVVNRGGWSHPFIAPTAQRGGRLPCPGGLRGVDSPSLRGLGQRPGNFFFGPYIRLGKPTYGISAHGFVCDGFRSMVLDASACINMYCNIERNIMKNQAGIPSFGI